MLSVRLPPDLEARLDRLCRETGRSRSGLVKEAIARYLAGEAGMGAVPSAAPAGGRDARPRRRSGHARIDARSLAMHRAIADKVRRNPRLLDAARDNIRRWRRLGVDVSAFAEWEAILDRGLAETLRVLCDPSEEAARLRHSTPFTGVLTQKERRRFFEAPRA
ncbi:MAG: ribbon-helix-helix domain-containing protein [Deltaproteobacteria bacterium]|nr:ribbon-helix-helix domain-containing protein [Deltaproteobacteria bacterium]